MTAAGADTARDGIWARGPAPGASVLPGLRQFARSFAPRAGTLALLIILAATLLRLHDAGTDAFWKNELFSMVWIRQPVTWLLSEGMRVETNPPLHFLMLKGWTALFGTSEFAARLPSVLASVVAVALTIRLGGELFGTRVALLGGVLLAVTPVQIVFAHEARVYALVSVFALLAMLGANRLLRAAETAPGEAPRSAVILFALGAAGLMHSHATGVFVVAALGLVTLLALLDSPHPGPAVRRLILAGLAAGLTATPVLVAMALQTGSDNIGWMPKLGIDTPILLNRFLLIGPMVRDDLGEAASQAELLAEMALGTATALVLIVLAFRQIRAPRPRALLLLFPLLFVLLLAGVSLLRPVLIPRVALWASAPICLCAAAILTGRLAWWVRGGAGLLLGCCIAVGMWNNVLAPAQHKPDWRALLAAFPGTATDGPVLVAGPHAGPLGIAFYSDAPVMRPLFHWMADATRPATTAERQERAVSGAPILDTASLAILVAAGRDVVLFLDDDDEGLIKGLLARQTWFTGAQRMVLPGLVAFTLPGRSSNGE